MLGIYEKALPVNISWNERLSIAKKLGFDFVEISIDESDERLSRLAWDQKALSDVRKAIEDNELPILSMCLSGHRRFPLGSTDPNVREKALEIMRQAIRISEYLGIRNIQLAGYDVYYDAKSTLTRELFIEGLQKCVDMAAQRCVMLSIETMDDPFINSITKVKKLKKIVKSPWLQVYPDIGNINAWPENILGDELDEGIQNVVQIHLKDTLKVTSDSPGKFKNVPFGKGDVDFVGALRTLKRLKYRGPYMIEMWSGQNSDHPLDKVKSAKYFIDEQFRMAGVDY